MRYNSLPKSTPAILSGPRGRTRAVLSSVSHGVAGSSIPVSVPAPKKRARVVRPAAPVIHHAIATASRLAG